MRIAVAVKPVPDADTRLRASADGRRWDEEGVKFVLAGYDESAVEQALLFKEAVAGTTVEAVSFGRQPWAEEVLRSALALGCDSARRIEAPADWPSLGDPASAAAALALAWKGGPPDLVLLGTRALDDEEGIVPGALARRLGAPGFSGVTDLRWDPEAQRFTFRRASEAGLERWEVKPPLVIGLQQAGNDPRTPKLPNILKARRLPIPAVPAAEVSAALAERTARSEAVGFWLPKPRTGAQILPYRTPEEAAQRLVEKLREEAKVFPP